MSAVQIRTDNDITPFIRAGRGVTVNDAVFLQDAGRLIDLKFGTVLAKIAATGKWVPFTDEAATDGSAVPQGILVGSDITAAELVAGDVPDRVVLVGISVIVSLDKVIIEGGKTLDTVITVGTTDLRTVKDRLAARGIHTEETVAISGFEN